MAAAKVISVQFFELDTSSVLIVINQDGTYSNVSLADGATVTFNSILTDLDPTLPISDQPDLIPGGQKQLLRRRLQTMLPGEVLIINKRVAYAYSNKCGVVDLIEVGEKTWRFLSLFLSSRPQLFSSPTSR